MGIRDIRIGPARAYYDGVDLGLTQGGIEVDMETSTHDTFADQFGETEIAQTIEKRSIMVTVPMLETTYQNLLNVMPGSRRVIDPDGVRTRVDIQTGIGINLYDIARKLVLRPLQNDVAVPKDFSEDFVLPLAGTAGALNFNYKHDEERMFPVEFTAYPDTVSQMIAFYGDESAGAPTISSHNANDAVTGDTLTLTWADNGNLDHANYLVYAGSVHGADNYFNSGVIAPGTLTSTVSGLPENGSIVYITLYWLQQGSWSSASVPIISN